MAEYQASSCPDNLKIGDCIIFNPKNTLRLVRIVNHEGRLLPTDNGGDCRNLLRRARGADPRIFNNDPQESEAFNEAFNIAADQRYPDVAVIEKHHGHRLARFMKFLYSLEFLTLEYRP